MKTILRGLAAAGILGLVAAMAATGAFATRSAKHATAAVCVLLPDTKSSARYELFDRPYLDQALTAAGVSHTILNAQGDAQTQKSQADGCMANGAKVVLLDQLDPTSGPRSRTRSWKAAARSSTTTGSSSARRPRSTSPSTTSRSACCRAWASSRR